MSDDLKEALSKFIDEQAPTSKLAQRFTALYGPTPDLLDVFVDIYTMYGEDYFSVYDRSEEESFEDMFIMYIGRKYKAFTDALLATDRASLDVGAWKQKGRAFGSLGVGDVDAVVSGTYRPHTCNLLNTTTSRAMTYYLMGISAQLTNVCVQPILSINRLGVPDLQGEVVHCNQEFSVFFVNTVVTPQENVLEGHAMLLTADHLTSTWSLVDVNRTTSRADIGTSYYPYPLDAVLNAFLDASLGGEWSESPEGALCPNISRTYLDDYVFTGYCGPYSALTVLHRFCGTRPPTRNQYGLRIDLLNLKEAIFDNAAKHNLDDFKDGRGIVQVQISECNRLRTTGTQFRPCGD